MRILRRAQDERSWAEPSLLSGCSTPQPSFPRRRESRLPAAAKQLKGKIFWIPASAGKTRLVASPISPLKPLVLSSVEGCA